MMKYLRIDGLNTDLNPFSELTFGELFSESVFYFGIFGMLTFSVYCLYLIFPQDWQSPRSHLFS